MSRINWLRAKWINLLSVLFAAAPFGAGLIRALQAVHDMRLLWMALASFVGATATMAAARRVSQVPALLSSSVWAFLIATLLAGTAALLSGASAAPGIWALATVFGFCSAVGRALDTLSHPLGV
jgi:hypothetical protein